MAAAEQAIRKAYRIYRAEGTNWLRAQGLLVEGDPERFPPAVSERLLDLGWFKGRDVSQRVEPWLAHWAEQLPKFRLPERGYPPYEPLPPATAVLREFGDLVSRDNGPGVSAARIPFVIFPHDGQDDLAPFVLDVALFSDRLGKRLFQVGVLEDGTVALLVAEDGRVYTTGAIELYLGETFDEALVGLVEGHQFEQA